MRSDSQGPVVRLFMEEQIDFQPQPAAEAIGMGVLSAFVRAGLVASTGEARRQIKGGGLRLNDEPVMDEKSALTAANFKDGVAKLSLGKKKHVLMRAE